MLQSLHHLGNREVAVLLYTGHSSLYDFCVAGNTGFHPTGSVPVKQSRPQSGRLQHMERPPSSPVAGA